MVINRANLNGSITAPDVTARKRITVLKKHKTKNIIKHNNVIIDTEKHEVKISKTKITEIQI